MDPNRGQRVTSWTPELRVADPTCAHGCWWYARILRFGKSHNGWCWYSPIAEALVAALHGARVGIYRDGGLLTHPPAEREGYRVGIVESAWVVSGGVETVVHLAHDATVVRRALLALERAGVLPETIGLSLIAAARVVPRHVCGEPVAIVTAVDYVETVDMVSHPSAEGALLRSLAPNTEAL